MKRWFLVLILAMLSVCGLMVSAEKPKAENQKTATPKTIKTVYDYSLVDSRWKGNSALLL